LAFAGIGGIVVIAFLILSITLGPGLLRASYSTNGQSGGNSTKTGPAINPNVISADTLVNYGNGTSIWYNETNVPTGSTFYSLTLQIANGHVGSIDEPPLGHFITSINGVTSNGVGSNCSICWGIWIYCANDSAWMYSLLGADSLKLNNGDVLAWFIQDITQNQSPMQGVKTVTTCSA
jgi:hypothetical protein